MAAFGGRYESCQVLLMRNADPNAGTRTGDTPLHIVSIHGYSKIVSYIIIIMVLKNNNIVIG